MKSIKLSHIVVVADSDHGHFLAARLRRMEVARVTAVGSLEEARHLCQGDGADACLVAIDVAVPDGIPVVESDAPGRSSGVPALLVAPVVTPHLRRTARRCGYLAAVSATIPPRLLYRCLGAALQRHRGTRRPRSPRGGMLLVASSNPVVFGKPTLH